VLMHGPVEEAIAVQQMEPTQYGLMRVIAEKSDYLIGGEETKARYRAQDGDVALHEAKPRRRFGAREAFEGENTRAHTTPTYPHR
jgi:hypothetical protein